LVSDLRLRLDSDEEIQSILADLEYGVMAELDEFARRLLVLLTATPEETMDHTIYNGLSASPQPAKTLLHEVPTCRYQKLHFAQRVGRLRVSVTRYRSRRKRYLVHQSISSKRSLW